MFKSECLWNPPPSVLELGDNEVHVWHANLSLPEWKIQELGHTLSLDEKARAERFVFGKHRRRFIAGRGFLRTILGRYLSLEPARLEFSYGSRGKPELVSNGPNGRLCFNLSHSNEMALYAISLNRSVGIDVEHIRPETDVEELAKRFFYPDEFAIIRSLSPGKKQEEFYKGWTVKEAYLKATGEGLAGIEHVEVSLSPGKPAVLTNVQRAGRGGKHWSSHQMKPARDYVAALVSEGEGWRLSHLWSF